MSEEELKLHEKRQAGTWWFLLLVTFAFWAAGHFCWGWLFPDDPWLLERRLLEKLEMIAPGLVVLSGAYLVLDRILHFNISEVVRNDPKALAQLVGLFLVCVTLICIFS